jgi:hypothetical protein
MNLDGERLTRHAVPRLPEELWCWLLSRPLVRDEVVADARARLAAGLRPSALELAEAVIRAPGTARAGS